MTPPRYYSRQSRTVATQGGNLPHWTQTCATFVTFRLADSLPAAKLAAYRAEAGDWLGAHPTPWDDATEAEYTALFSDRFQTWLDAGYGSCILRDMRLRAIVEDSLRHFAGDRYSLYAFVVMPNHVHVLFMPEEGRDGRRIVADWKRFTAKAINAEHGESGGLWQKESYDHLVRNVEEFNKIRAYIRGNDPALAFDAYAHVDAERPRQPVDAESSPRREKEVLSLFGRGGDSASTGEGGVDAESSPRREKEDPSLFGRGGDSASMGEGGVDAESSPRREKEDPSLVARGGDTASTVVRGVRAAVSLGSNIEPRREYLKRALEALSRLPETRLVRASSVIETEPVDVPAEFAGQKFLNQAAVFETKLSPQEFSQRMHAIEDDLGRIRTVRNGPRTIDIDLIDFGGQVLNTPELTLPHPRAHFRDFVQRPLREILGNCRNSNNCVSDGRVEYMTKMR